MKYNELEPLATELLYYFGPGVKEFDNDEERLEVYEAACEFIQAAIEYLGIGALFKNGRLNRSSIAITWALTMLELSDAIAIDMVSRGDGFMLSARIDKGQAVAGYITTKDYTVRQLFFWNDTRSVYDMRELCRMRAEQLIAAIETDNKTN